MTTLALTSSQTVGPFFQDCLLCADALRNVIASTETAGERIRIEGRVLDGDGQPVPDALIEIWQANHEGNYNSEANESEQPLDQSFIGFGRTGTDSDGGYWFETIKPGRVLFKDGEFQSPHICIAVFARGLLNHLYTRLYFADDPANSDDPVLRCVPVKRRATLLAQSTQSSDEGSVIYRFDIVLQGTCETVFFNI